MATGTVTIEIDQATAVVLQMLQAKAAAQGIPLDVFLRQFAEGENGAATYTIQSETAQLAPDELGKDSIDSKETIGERLERKGLLGTIDSSEPDDPASPRQRDALFYLIADDLKKQGLKVS
jgi:hypothetical protein